MQTNLSLLVILLFTLTTSAQHQNLKNGLAAKGYDVVSYFDGKAEKGSKEFELKHDDVKYRFTSEAHREKFKKDPAKYQPQYGGYCAYAIGKTGEKVDIDPETYEIRDGKLYLFYNSWGTNTLDMWQEEGAEELRSKADNNWKSITRGN